MDDRTAWKQAVAATSEWYFSLSSGNQAELDRLLEESMQFKQKLVELVTSSGSSEVCRSCGGECCLRGKFHVTVLDILAYVKTGVVPLAPDFSSGPACPYSDASGCLMPSVYRPVTCVIFNCELLEERLSPAERDMLYAYENSLRATTARAGRIGGKRLDRPLLLSGS